MHHAYDFIGLPVVAEAFPEGAFVSEESARGTLIQHHGQGLRSVSLAPLVQLHEFPAGQHRLAQSGKIARAHSLLDRRYLNTRRSLRIFRSHLESQIFIIFGRKWRLRRQGDAAH